jgi:pyrophosphatase PpaX
MRHPVVLFDLDGTLIDSGPIILASFRHATSTVLGRRIPDAELLASVGGSTLQEQMRVFDPERVEELVTCYREHNELAHAELAAFAWIEPLLVRLQEEGRRLGIVTAKRRITVQLAFDVLPWLEGHFEVVVGAEDTRRHKPDPEPLLFALEQLGAEPREAAYVGDSPFDVAAAKAAGCFAIAVTWGGIHDDARLAEEQPDVIVHDPEELLGVL